MKPIETLMAEHRLIEKMLDALLAWSDGMLSRHADERTELGRFVTFVREFVDPVHHAKEEGILFAAMTEHGFPKNHGPVAVMLHEHDTFRSLIQTLALRAHQSSVWSEAERREIAQAAHEYAELLRQHISKEDRILYPMSEARLSNEAKLRIETGFKRFEKEQGAPAERARLMASAESFMAWNLPAAR